MLTILLRRKDDRTHPLTCLVVLGLSLGLTFMSCMALSKSLSVAEPQFPSVHNGYSTV